MHVYSHSRHCANLREQERVHHDIQPVVLHSRREGVVQHWQQRIVVQVHLQRRKVVRLCTLHNRVHLKLHVGLRML